MNEIANKTTGINLPTSGFFITGTDTDVGKTYAAACIAFTIKLNGDSIIPRKPVASGCIKQPDGSYWVEDAESLKNASQSNESIDSICPFQFEPAISPQTAITQAGLTITVDDLINACQFNSTDSYLVEGAGGFYSPLCSDGLNQDLASKLNFPIILVVKNRLGCINHALLTIEAIKNKGLHIHAIVLNFANQEDFASDLKLWTEVPIWRLNYQADKSLQVISELSQSHE